MTKRENRARVLRQRTTDAETALWASLRDRRLNGRKFVRQAPVGSYFADFLCRERMLIVELDGSQHDGSDHDTRRDAWLAEQGYTIVRFWNADVLDNKLLAVLETILAALEGRLKAQISADLKVKMTSR